MWQGTTDDGCVALADLLGWKVCHYQINTLTPGCIKQLNIEWEFATFSFDRFLLYSVGVSCPLVEKGVVV